MAALTHLETKLGEVLGLAMAAKAATNKVEKLLPGDAGLAATLKQMHQEAAETETRCTQAAATFPGRKTAIHDHANATKQKAAQMLDIYLDDESAALDGFEFLTMAEADEVGHWSVLQVMNEQIGDQHIAKLIHWALPIQQRHYSDAAEGAKQLAAATDATQPR
jgi:hypothetical protein